MIHQYPNKKIVTCLANINIKKSHSLIPDCKGGISLHETEVEY